MPSDPQSPRFIHGSGTGTSAGSSTLFFLCHLNPRKIGMLRFLLEGYDGLTTLTTLNASKGLVCCLVPNGQCMILSQLLESFNAEGRIYSFIRLGYFSDVRFFTEASNFFAGNKLISKLSD
jgi:hypothetical protein